MDKTLIEHSRAWQIRDTLHNACIVQQQLHDIVHDHKYQNTPHLLLPNLQVLYLTT